MSAANKTFLAEAVLFDMVSEHAYAITERATNPLF